MVRVVVLSLVVLVAVARAETAGPSGASAQQIVELARELAAKPNDPQLHAKIAVAYFERGAAGDAARVSAHAARAAQLDPGAGTELAAKLEGAQPGIDVQAETAEAQLADLQAEASLPSAGGDSSDGLIRARLAERIARSRFEPPSSKYPKNLATVQQLYDPAADPDSGSWNEREQVLKHDGGGTPSPVLKAFVATMRRVVKLREQAAARRGSASSDEPPDPMLLKGQAFLSWVDGDVNGAVALLQQTAAAADTVAKRAQDKVSDATDDAPAAPARTAGTGPAAAGAPPDGKPVDDDFGDDSAPERTRVATPKRVMDATPPRTDDATPPRDQAVTPPRTDDVTPPRDQAVTPPRTDDTTPPRDQAVTPPRADDATPPRDQAVTPPRTDDTTPARTEPTAPPRTQPPQAPPQSMKRIGEQALEGVEAAKTPQVAPPEVTRKITELAQTGEVGEPLVLDLDGDGRPSIPGGLAPDGRLEPGAVVRFDIYGDGHAYQVEWMRPGDALICQDVDGDGRITSGRELPGAVPGAGSAEQWLERRDLDGDGVLSGRELNGILLWKDDGDGVCQPGELLTPEQVGLEKIVIHGPHGVQAVLHGQTRAVWEWWPDIRR